MADKPSLIRQTDAQAIGLGRALLRQARYAALAVLDPATGAPMASRVGLATDLDGAPLILISLLAAHTAALLADARASLLVGEPAKGDPLAHPRMTLACLAVALEKETPDQARIARRYLNRNPKAKLYSGLGDFRWFRLEPERASLNGGFGKAYKLSRDELLAPPPDGLAEAEQAAIDHMNSDHTEALAIYARAFAGAGEGRFRLTGIDGEGLDLADGDKGVRVLYPAPLRSVGELRPVLVAMAAEGRRRLASVTHS